jgi:hypothetical protein
VFRRPSLGTHRRTVLGFIGETVLIVVGVLLALSLDEWRQSRSRQAAAEEAIASIGAEIAANRELALAARDYHRQRLQLIGERMRSDEPLTSADFPDGFTNPARFLSAAWETAREAGELVAVDRDLRQRVAVAYSWQDRYAQQIASVSALIYESLFAGGRDALVGNPEGLMMLVGAFAWREEEIIGIYDQTLQALGAGP